MVYESTLAIHGLLQFDYIELKKGVKQIIHLFTKKETMLQNMEGEKITLSSTTIT